MLMKTHGPAIFPSSAQEIAREFQLEERPLNSTEVPCDSRLKWGHLLRFSQSSIPAILDYLNILRPSDSSLPILIELGANLAIVLAFSPSAEEPLRLGLCCKWQAGLAIDDLGAWLRTFPRDTSLQKIRRELEWISPGYFSSMKSCGLLEATP
jgi:hypothetical protein